MQRLGVNYQIKESNVFRRERQETVRKREKRTNFFLKKEMLNLMIKLTTHTS